jgi:hypothetical protein
MGDSPRTFLSVIAHQNARVSDPAGLPTGRSCRQASGSRWQAGNTSTAYRILDSSIFHAYVLLGTISLNKCSDETKRYSSGAIKTWRQE